MTADIVPTRPPVVPLDHSLVRMFSYIKIIVNCFEVDSHMQGIASVLILQLR